MEIVVFLAAVKKELFNFRSRINEFMKPAPVKWYIQWFLVAL